MLKKAGITCSMSRKGNCWDSAVVEGFFSTLKREWVQDRRYRRGAEARADIFHYIEVWYNRKRRHSTFGHLSPAEFESKAVNRPLDPSPEKWGKIMNVVKVHVFNRNSKKMHANSTTEPIFGQRPGLILIHSAVFLFGFAGLIGKLINAGPAVITFGRTFFAALALLFGFIATGRSLAIRKRSDLITLCLSGLLLATHWFTFFQSIKVSSVAIGLLTFSTFPIFVTFMEPFLFGEKLEKSDVAVSIIVAAGLAMLVPSFDFSNNVTQGIFWGVLSGFTFAVLSVLNRMHVNKHPFLTITLYQLGFATLFNLPFVILDGVLPSARDILLLLVLGTICTALAHALFIGSLKHIKARSASITTGLEPVYGIIFSFLLMGEVPSLKTLLGGLVILGVVFLPMIRSGHFRPVQ